MRMGNRPPSPALPAKAGIQTLRMLGCLLPLLLLPTGAESAAPAPAPSAWGSMAADLFAPPPQPPKPRPVVAPVVVPAPPPPPMAPPLPFRYLGRWQEANTGVVVFLAQGETLYRARMGDTLAGWRLDRIDAAALDFTWIALQQRQTLRTPP